MGKVAIDYLATALECRKAKHFLSSSFPPQVVVSSGLTKLLNAELLVPEDVKDMLILSGDAQPLETVGMYHLAGEILDVLKEEGVQDVITLAAYVGDAKEKVLGASTDVDSARCLTEAGVPLLRNGAIGGLNGLLAGLAPVHGMRGFCLLGTSSGTDPVDIGAAINLLRALKDLLGLPMEITLLEPQPEGLEASIPVEPDMNYR